MIREQFGENSSTQFTGKRVDYKNLPRIFRKTELYNANGQLVAEVPAILNYDEIVSKYAGVATVVWSADVKFGWEKVRAFHAEIPLGILADVRGFGEGEDRAEPGFGPHGDGKGLLATLFSNPAALGLLGKITGGQANQMTAEEAAALAEIVKSLVGKAGV